MGKTYDAMPNINTTFKFLFNGLFHTEWFLEGIFQEVEHLLCIHPLIVTVISASRKNVECQYFPNVCSFFKTILFNTNEFGIFIILFAN